VPRKPGDERPRNRGKVTRREGADGVAEALHTARTAAGVFEPGELPIDGYDDLNVSETVAAVKEVTEPADVRAIVADDLTSRE
jgi:hypothetical protein